MHVVNLILVNNCVYFTEATEELELQMSWRNTEHPIQHPGGFIKEHFGGPHHIIFILI